MALWSSQRQRLNDNTLTSQRQGRIIMTGMSKASADICDLCKTNMNIMIGMSKGFSGQQLRPVGTVTNDAEIYLVASLSLLV